MNCHHCETPITTEKPSVVQVTGWVKDRKAGGVNQVRDSKPTGKVLCRSCGDYFWLAGKLPSLVNEDQLVLA